jgi:hypothetical protein
MHACSLTLFNADIACDSPTCVHLEKTSGVSSRDRQQLRTLAHDPNGFRRMSITHREQRAGAALAGIAVNMDAGQPVRLAL